MLKEVSQVAAKEVVASYLGLIRHGNMFVLRSEINEAVLDLVGDHEAAAHR